MTTLWVVWNEGRNFQTIFFQSEVYFLSVFETNYGWKSWKKVFISGKTPLHLFLLFLIRSGMKWFLMMTYVKMWALRPPAQLQLCWDPPEIWNKATWSFARTWRLLWPRRCNRQKLFPTTFEDLHFLSRSTNSTSKTGAVWKVRISSFSLTYAQTYPPPRKPWKLWCGGQWKFQHVHVNFKDSGHNGLCSFWAILTKFANIHCLRQRGFHTSANKMV